MVPPDQARDFRADQGIDDLVGAGLVERAGRPSRGQPGGVNAGRSGGLVSGRRVLDGECPDLAAA
jgi:hypothetical protein